MECHVSPKTVAFATDSMGRRCKNDRDCCRLSDGDEDEASDMRHLCLILDCHVSPKTIAFATDSMGRRRKNDRDRCRLSDGSEFLKIYIYILNIYKPISL